MTLCIAAVCDVVDGREPKVVLCADMQREEDGIGASETEDKLGYVHKGWPSLMAGAIHRGTDLQNVYAEYLLNHFSEVTEYNVLTLLREPAQIQKKTGGCVPSSDVYLRLWASVRERRGVLA